MRLVKCDRCKGEISPETRQKLRNIYNISYIGTYMDLCDNCYYKLVRFINNVDALSKIESVKNGSRPTKESDTQFYHLNCKTIVKGQ